MIKKNRIRSEDITQAKIGKSYEIGYNTHIVNWEWNKTKQMIEHLVKDKILE